MENLEIRNLCSAVMLSRDAFFETLRLLYSPTNEEDECDLHIFCTAICEVWRHFGDDIERWDSFTRWLKEKNVYQAPLSIANLNQIALQVELFLEAEDAQHFRLG